MARKKLQTVLVLQGGGALGAYQAGAVQGLLDHGVDFDWVVGTSIGAINGAIIAGNPPEHRLPRLKAFWDQVGHADVPMFPLQVFPWLAPLAGMSRVMGPLLNGVPGFFSPRPGSLFNLNGMMPTHEVGFYDTSALEGTLNALVDFEYLAEAHVRYCACAVHIPNGELAVFDNTQIELTPKHIMASGALPPGFPPVVIDNEAYWDGGIYSNTPLELVLTDARKNDTLCFMIDLWDPTERTPGTINEAISRHKDITYASRSKENLNAHRKLQDMRRAIRRLAKLVPAAKQKDPNIKRLLAMGNDASVDIVRLIMKALPDDSHSKDIDFSRGTLSARWAAGLHDMGRVCENKSWLNPRADHVGLVVHELVQE